MCRTAGTRFETQTFLPKSTKRWEEEEEEDLDEEVEEANAFKEGPEPVYH